MDIQPYILRIANMFNEVMKDKLVGTYLHGSSEKQTYES
jgi:hypothetical protein